MASRVHPCHHWKTIDEPVERRKRESR